MNLAACATLPRNPENETWYRALDPYHIRTALNSAHTAGTRSRFNPGSLGVFSSQFESLYFAEDPVVAAYETGAIVGHLWKPGNSVPNPRKNAFVTINVAVILHQVVDLTDVAGVHAPLQTNVQELTGDWDCYSVRNSATSVHSPTGIAPSQELGRELFRTPDVEGFWATSAKVPYQRNLIVFPQKLRTGSSLVFRDSRDLSGSPIHSIP